MVLHPSFYLPLVCRIRIRPQRNPVAQQPFGFFRIHSMRRADHLDCLNLFPTKLAVYKWSKDYDLPYAEKERNLLPVLTLVTLIMLITLKDCRDCTATLPLPAVAQNRPFDASQPFVNLYFPSS